MDQVFLTHSSATLLHLLKFTVSSMPTKKHGYGTEKMYDMCSHYWGQLCWSFPAPALGKIPKGGISD